MSFDLHIHAPGVRWIWFDLDDTLIDFRANSRAALRWLYDTQGLSRFHSSAEEWTEAYERHNHALWELYNSGSISQDYLRVNRFVLPLLESRPDENRGNLEEFSRTLDPLYLSMLAEQKKLVDGAMDLLIRLKGDGYNIGILSNGFTDVQHRKLSVTGIARHIDLTVLSDDIGVNKPDIRLYRHAMERAGDGEAAHHLMIGDNPSTDMAGAAGAGWHAILLDPTGDAPRSRSYATINSLRELT